MYLYIRFSLLIILLMSKLISMVNSANEVRQVSDDLRRLLKKHTLDMDEVFKHSIVRKGVGPGGVVVEERSALKREDNHDIVIQPPFIGSFCSYEEYNRLFNQYYNTPFERHDQRLYFNREILRIFSEKIDASYAWSVCQYGGIKLQCSSARSRCACLNEKSPDKYIEGPNATCVGVAGSVCTNYKEAPIKCEQKLKCIDGFCGGIEVTAKILVSSGIQVEIMSNVLNLVIFLIVSYFI